MAEQIIHERRIRQSKTLKGENDRLWNDNPHKKCYKDYFNMIKDLFFKKYKMYLQPIITQYFMCNKSEIWSLSLIVHSKG